MTKRPDLDEDKVVFLTAREMAALGHAALILRRLQAQGVRGVDLPENIRDAFEPGIEKILKRKNELFGVSNDD